jgi:hypothetical protein
MGLCRQGRSLICIFKRGRRSVWPVHPRLSIFATVFIIFPRSGDNKMKKNSGIQLYLILVLAGMSSSALANLVTNPSFETFSGTFGGDGGRQLLPGATTLSGWNIIGGEIAILKDPNVYQLTPSDGNYFIDLTGYSNGGFPKGVSQTLTGLTEGQAYSFSMDLGIRNGACVGGGNNCNGPIQATAQIGSHSEMFTHNSTAPGNIWGTYGFTFTADNPTMTLSILGNSLPVGGAYIGLDNVSVSAVPMPAAVWLFGTGFLAMLGMSRVRRGLFD